MDIIKLPIERRDLRGSANARRTRRSGRIPAVLYGLGRDPVSVSVDEHTFAMEFDRGHRVFDLQLGVEGKEQIVILKDVQFDPLGDRAIHVDFARVDEKAPLELSLPLELEGEPQAVSGASLNFMMPDIRVSCDPRAIPENVTIPVHDLKPGDVVTAADVKLPESVTLVTDANASIVSYQLMRATEEETAEEADSPEVLTERPDED